MKLKKEIGNKYLTATTRKANFSMEYFAKYTIWPSINAYDKGDCMNTITINNIYLGIDLSKAEDVIIESATSLLKEMGAS